MGYQQFDKNPESTLSRDALATLISYRLNEKRLFIAIAGPPACGKSTTAEILKNTLLQRHEIHAQVVPMDGFHYDNKVLDQQGLRSKKGAPNTFDVAGLTTLLQRITEQSTAQPLAIPLFDRSHDCVHAEAEIISSRTQVFLIEGNYLLLKDLPWSNLMPYFDLTVMISCPTSVLRKRLLQRWKDYRFSESDAVQKVETNDLLNADWVIKHSVEPDVHLNQ